MPNSHFNKDNAPAAYGVIFDSFGNLAHFYFVVGHCLLSFKLDSFWCSVGFVALGQSIAS